MVSILEFQQAETVVWSRFTVYVFTEPQGNIRISGSYQAIWLYSFLIVSPIRQTRTSSANHRQTVNDFQKLTNLTLSLAPRKNERNSRVDFVAIHIKKTVVRIFFPVRLHVTSVK